MTEENNNLHDRHNISSQEHGQYAHFISFGFTALAGFNIPVSEDLVFIISASCRNNRPENSVKIFTGCFTVLVERYNRLYHRAIRH